VDDEVTNVEFPPLPRPPSTGRTPSVRIIVDRPAVNTSAAQPTWTSMACGCGGGFQFDGSWRGHSFGCPGAYQAAAPQPTPVYQFVSVPSPISDADVERIARRVVELLKAQ
jgi:hypothetical protein